MSSRSHRSKIRWLIFSAVLILAAVAVLSGVVRFEKILHGNLCVRCGARYDSRSYAVSIFSWRLEVAGSAKSTPSQLTTLWSRYAGGCSHDWTAIYENRFGVSSGFYADYFPNQRYPVAVGTEELAEGIRWCDVPNARIAALNAIGNRNNLLRFVAAETLRSVGTTNHPVRPTPTEWWLSNSNRFAVCTNKHDAEVFLDALNVGDDSLLGYAVEQSREILERGP
jgi:hypothetical protein